MWFTEKFNFIPDSIIATLVANAFIIRGMHKNTMDIFSCLSIYIRNHDRIDTNRTVGKNQIQV